jgi:hypothetical protein
MVRRSLLGLGEGLLIGAALGIAFVRGLGLVAPGGGVLALLGALAGFAVGLVAGRPIWARDAKTEALLKSAAGALGGFGLTFALRHWLKVQIDLDRYSLGAGPAGQLAAVTLPAVAAALGLLFELDDDGRRSSDDSGVRRPAKRRVGARNADPATSENEEQPTDVVDRKLEKR